MAPRGLIPARAGNTFPFGRFAPRAGAHPRSRGEHSARWATSTSRLGSSPLARGTHGGERALERGAGLIPARAGNTRCRHSSGSFAGAHPRSRGEHAISLSSPGSRMGSSPLARGTPLPMSPKMSETGLIPARAGNTYQPLVWPPTNGAHPRSRGEHLVQNTPLRLSWGSSPLARGTQPRRAPHRHLRGLIPARAGNTRRARKESVCYWAHPRSRGEHGL